MLDNAIHANEHDNGIKKITVIANKQGDYLVIKVRNTMMNTKHKKTRRKQYGREILKEIAMMYHGKSIYHLENNEYEAVVTLLCSEGGRTNDCGNM